MDVLFDLNVLLDVVFRREGHYEHSALATSTVFENGHRPWVYTGSVQTLHYLAISELRRINPELNHKQAIQQAARVLQEALTPFQWLASLAGEGEGIFSEADPEDAQLLRALKRLGPEAILLTRDHELLTATPQALHPRDFLQPSGELQPLTSDLSSLPFIDLSRQQDHIRPALEDRMHRVLHHGQYIMGPEIQELEERLSEYVGAKHCITASSGTDTLLIALMALGIGRGDEVITVPYTWISTAEVISLLGAVPVFVDIEADTWNLDPAKLEASITEKTKVIMPVGIYGQPANMTAINAIAAKHGNLPVIEDAAQCFGSTHHGKKSCNLSRIGSTSFFPTKPLGGYGDGGALFTDDDALADKMRAIRLHGQTKKHHHPYLGINGRLDTLQAAIVLAKIEVFEDEIFRRQAVARLYVESFESMETHSGCEPDSAKIRLPAVRAENTSVFAQFTLLCENRNALSQHLKDRGIPSVSYYAVPLHLQPVFAYLGHKSGDFPVAEHVASTCLSLPMNPDLDSPQIHRITSAIAEWAVGGRR